MQIVLKEMQIIRYSQGKRNVCLQRGGPMKRSINKVLFLSFALMNMLHAAPEPKDVEITATNGAARALHAQRVYQMRQLQQQKKNIKEAKKKLDAQKAKLARLASVSSAKARLLKLKKERDKKKSHDAKRARHHKHKHDKKHSKHGRRTVIITKAGSGQHKQGKRLLAQDGTVIYFV